MPRLLLPTMLAALALTAPATALAQQPMSARQLLDYAETARAEGDDAQAERAYRALMEDADPLIRDEARFRLAMFYSSRREHLREAAVLLRRILDDHPENSGVRLALAKVLAQMGQMDGAARELRAARAAGLPPQVERQVRFFEASLQSPRRVGASIEVALAPSSNINRATGADTLGTVLGEFALSEDAQAKSGIGIGLRGQGFARLPLASAADLEVKAAASGLFYADGAFNDMTTQLSAGPLFRFGRARLKADGLVAHRWYGGSPYSLSYGAQADLRAPVGRRAQVTAGLRAVRQENRRNRLQDATSFAADIGLERAFDARSGAGVQLAGSRDAARDPGFSTAAGSVRVFGWRQLGRTTLVADASYRRLEADRRLLIYPERRCDDYVQAGLSGTFRSFTLGSFAPFVRLRYERNRSTVAIYDFEREGADFGLTAAF